MLVEVSGLGISGYQALDWLRAEKGIGLGMSDHRRVEAHRHARGRRQHDRPPGRRAGRVSPDAVPARVAARRRSDRRRAATPSPYPVPVRDPITREALDYLRSGVAAGMQLPDPADAKLETVKVVAKR